MKLVNKYQSFDGREFDTAEECKRHEADSFALRLVGLTAEQITAALSREDVELANALERAGTLIATKRRESGDLRRVRNGAAKAVTAPPTAPDIAPDDGPRMDGEPYPHVFVEEGVDP